MEPNGEFELLDHPADIGFRAFGDTQADLFANCAAALLWIACDTSGIRPDNRYRLWVSGSDTESLLVDWLNEVLYWFDGKRVALQSFQIDHLDDTSLIATALGEPRDPERHRGKTIVKGVTYHQLRVAEQDGRWLAEVFLDV